MKLAILGAGAWGTALAIQAAARHEVRLWARDPAQAAELQRQRCNTRYLPEVALPAALQVDAGRDQALAGAELIVIASPMAGLARMPARRLRRYATPLLWLCKGFEAGSGRLGHEIARELGREPGRHPVRPQLRAGGGARPGHRAGGRQPSDPAVAERGRGRPSTASACASTPRPTRSASRSAVR
jgi:hypothetical protein